MTVALASLGGIPFRLNVDAVRWTFDMKTAQFDTVGGRVIQVIGTDLGDMTISGSFGAGDKIVGDKEGWQDQARFVPQVQGWAEQAQNKLKPLRFLYAPRNWDFLVYVKSFSSPDGKSVRLSNDIYSPKWSLTLFIVEDRSQAVTKGITDVYLTRLMAGVGWKQTEFNGPLDGTNTPNALVQQQTDVSRIYAGGTP